MLSVAVVVVIRVEITTTTTMAAAAALGQSFAPGSSIRFNFLLFFSFGVAGRRPASFHLLFSLRCETAASSAAVRHSLSTGSTCSFRPPPQSNQSPIAP